MGSFTLPKKPVENWEQVRDEWVGTVERFMSEAESWAKKHDWGTRRETKRIVEDRLGPYEVPRLLVHGTFGRVLLDPVARFVVGADGLIDFFAIPSYEGKIVVLSQGEWSLLHDRDAEGQRSPWSDSVFVESALHLVESS